jgi:hypothetical protein
MVIDPKIPSKSHIYQAPKLFAKIFYLLLAAWVVVCIVFLNAILARFGLAGLYRLFMIALILFYMCYFAAGVSYKMEVWDEGDIRLTSYRRIINTHAEEIPIVEGPYLPLGFIRFRFEREKAYLFCLKNDEFLKKALSVIRNANPGINFKNL